MNVNTCENAYPKLLLHLYRMAYDLQKFRWNLET